MAEQRNPRWRNEGWGYTVGSVDDLGRAVSRIGTLRRDSQFVWRGVSDNRWRVRSSLYRTLADAATEADSPSEADLRAAEVGLLAAARDWGLGITASGLMTDLELLPLLQHHGLPTRLLDVTSNPMTALWFACQPTSHDRDVAGALFAFDVRDVAATPTLVGGLQWGMLDDRLGGSLDGVLREAQSTEKPFLLRPSLPDSRMVAQEGLFLSGAVPEEPTVKGVDGLSIVVGDPPYSDRLDPLFAPEERRPGRPAALPFVVLLIPPRLKSQMLTHLEGTYNRQRRVLFPDVAGMADAYRAGQLSLQL